MKNTVDSNPVRDAIDMPGLLARIARLEVEIGSIRQELVHSLGGPRLAFNADEVENEDLTTPPGFIALEILDGSGVVLDNGDVSLHEITVDNQTGQNVKLSEGPVGVGVVAISIPPGEKRGIKRHDDKHLKTEFVEYTYYQPDCVPGVICFLQVYRSLVARAADGGIGNSEDASSNIIKLEKKPTGGFGLTT